MPAADKSRRIWVFGYGSLAWRPGFGFDRCVPARAESWVRRFWQASADHRGTPARPGRVVTLVRKPLGQCDGRAYRLLPGCESETLAALDRREQGGYLRQRITLRLDDDSSITAITWIAFPGNALYLGPATSAAIAAQIRDAKGPSGSNREYFDRLCDTLEQLASRDAHLLRIARWLNAQEL